MDTRIGNDRQGGEPVEAANARFKRRAGVWFWGSVAAAVIVHFVVLSFGPSIEIIDVSAPPAAMARPLESIDILPRIELPAPPREIAVPALPVAADPGILIDEDITIEPVRFDEIRFADIPPPPSATAEELPEFRHFMPRMVRPELRNRTEVARALERHYPYRLRAAGVGGEVLVWFWIDEEGSVQKYEVKRSSGHEELDEAAVKVVDIMDFSPAIDRGRPVKVIVAIPIIFEVE